jgi:hypothetical protein
VEYTIDRNNCQHPKVSSYSSRCVGNVKKRKMLIKISIAMWFDNLCRALGHTNYKNKNMRTAKWFINNSPHVTMTTQSRTRDPVICCNHKHTKWRAHQLHTEWVLSISSHTDPSRQTYCADSRPPASYYSGFAYTLHLLILVAYLTMLSIYEYRHKQRLY